MGDSIATGISRTRSASGPVMMGVSRTQPRVEVIVARDDRPFTSSVLAELIWTALPEALDHGLVLAADSSLGVLPRAWVNPTDREGRFGLTVEQSESDKSAWRLIGWVLVRAEAQSMPGEQGEGSERCILFDYAVTPASSDEQRMRGELGSDDSARSALLNGRPDRLSLDITDSQGGELCRLSYLIQADGESVWWASSVLPERLGLAGGRYELAQVIVNGLAASPSA